MLIEASDQPAHPHNLNRVFDGRSMGSQRSNVSSGTCADPGIFVRGGPGQAEIYHFSRFQRGSNFYQGGSNCLFPIETHITCDFPGGGPDPLSPPLDPHLRRKTKTDQTLLMHRLNFTLCCIHMPTCTLCRIPAHFWLIGNSLCINLLNKMIFLILLCNYYAITILINDIDMAKACYL